MTVEIYEILLPVALILFLSKILSIGCKKIGLPQVVGMLLAGIIIGCIKYIPNQTILTEGVTQGISFMAEIGVILIMFEAGLGTDVKQIKSAGFSSIVVTSLGVIVPMALGFLVAGIFNGFTADNIWSNLFYGVILTATSVSVTVATLKELNRLNTRIGTIIVSAAIIDDVIGVIVLSVVLALSESAGITEILFVLLKVFGFIVFGILFGFGARKLFTFLDQKWSGHRLVPIFSLATCFLFAYLAEKVFGIADITGAYLAGIVLSSMRSTQYVDRRTEIISYLFFTPIFFAKIGITTEFSGFDLKFIGFGLCFVLAGILGKLLGCGLGAKITGANWKDSLRCGVGMMCRAEVCLICAEKGVKGGIIDSSIESFVVLLIMITSFVTPLILKATYKNEITQPVVNNSNIV